MLFADDIVFIDETREGINNKLERRRHTFESRGFRWSISKTNYLHYGFSGRGKRGGEVIINGMGIAKVELLKYLGSIIHQKADIG